MLFARQTWTVVVVALWLASAARAQVFQPVFQQFMDVAPSTTSPAPIRTTGPSNLSPDEQVLKGIHLDVTGPGLLEFFRQRTHADITPAKVTQLVARLNDKGVPQRDQAEAELVKLGTPVLPWLRQAANSLDDPEAADRARHCLQALEGTGGATVPAAAARVLALRKPPGAADVLLAYLPRADDDNVVQAVENSLAAVAFREGKLEAALVQALEDAVPVRRAVAAAVLCKVGKAEHRSAVRALLKDARPSVRLRAALGLAALQEAEAVPVLIDLLLELPQPQRSQAEAYLASLAEEWAIQIPQGHDDISRRLRRDLWNAWWHDHDGSSMLQELHKRTLPDAEWETVNALIHQLGDESFAVREKAANNLLALGQAAATLLRQAGNQPDPRISEYARKILQMIENDAPAPLPNAAVRLIQMRKPAGAAAALLAYLPFAESPSLAGQVQAALGELALRDGKPDPVLVRSLSDKIGQRRAAAAELLCQASEGEYRPAIRQLLKDQDPVVRLRVALALSEAHEKEAVPVLIALLEELPTEQGWQAEEYLASLAADQAPNVWLGYDETTRHKCRDAWASWWQANGAKIDWTKTDKTGGANTLVVENAPNSATGRVLEMDSLGRILWQIDNLNMPRDVQALAGGRVLVVEANGAKVSERSTKGEVSWEYQLANTQPFAGQRLSNGQTFIACPNKLVVVDRDKKVIFNLDRQNQDIVAARWLRGGHVAFVTSNGLYQRLDAAGQEMKSFRVGSMPNYFGAVFAILPNDHVLVPEYGRGARLVEYDGNGRPVNEIPLTDNPTSIVRLPNGHLLMTSNQTQRIFEMDAKGKVVWDHKDNAMHPTRACR